MKRARSTGTAVCAATRRREAGFTLLEAVAVGAMLAGLAAVLVNLMAAGRDGNRIVMQQTATTEDLRRATDRLIEDLSQSSTARVAVTTLADGNSRVTLQTPIDVVGGLIVWGVRDPSLGATDALRVRPGWFVCYTVQTVGTGAQIERNLIRQLIDDALVVRREELIARRLQSGVGTQPGFRAVAAGAMWTLTISALPTREGERGNSVSFEVWPRN